VSARRLLPPRAPAPRSRALGLAGAVGLALALDAALARALVARDPIAWAIRGPWPVVVGALGALIVARVFLYLVAPAWIAGEAAAAAWRAIEARRRRGAPRA